MLRTIQNIVRKAYGDRPIIRSLEEWATDTAKLATPDDLIAAGVIRSFAKDFNKWKLRGTFEFGRTDGVEGIECSRTLTISPCLSNGDLEVRFSIDRHQERDWSFEPWETCGKDVVRCFVNATEIAQANALLIRRSWDEISAKVKAANDAAAKAKAEMEANEAKWNLAEKLLGMKRNEFGALVPIESAS